MNFILFDDKNFRESLLPLTYTRPICDIRIGILTIREKWEFLLNTKTSSLTQDYLSEKFQLIMQSNNCFINGAILPDKIIINEIQKLKQNQALINNDIIIAVNSNSNEDIFDLEKFEIIKYNNSINFIKNTWDIFTKNNNELISDFDLVTSNKTSEPLSSTNTKIGNYPVFIEKGAIVECSVFNTTSGPIYIGKEAEVMEGSLIRGPFALCEYSTLKMGAKIYGATTIGPYCKVGGEVNNSVFLGYSNKAHDGFIGNSVIGEWCNIGADSNNSNLKNNYAEVKLWDYSQEKFINTNLQFCGLIMGDHSKCGINTMFNTGTVVGFSSNIYGSGFPRNFVPSFSWGGALGFTDFKLDKAVEIAKIVMERRNLIFDEKEYKIFEHIYSYSHKYRKI